MVQTQQSQAAKWYLQGSWAGQQNIPQHFLPSGRFGNLYLMKVSVADLENMEAYQYFTGLDEQGAPIW